MVSSSGFGNLTVILVLSGFFVLLSPAVSAVYNIEISPTEVLPDQEVTAVLHDIPQDLLVNMTINTTLHPSPGEEMDYVLRNWSFPYESGLSTYQVEILNLTPGTEATIDVLREDGTDASYTGNVSEIGRFNASIIHELDKAEYNVSFIGIPASDIVYSTIDFGGLTRTWNTTKGTQPTTESVTSTSKFTPSGITRGEVQVNVYIDYELQKTQTIKVINTA